MPVAMLVDNRRFLRHQRLGVRRDAYWFLNERLKPASEAVGVPGPPAPPQFWPVHNYAK
jgi:hypothetical protein